MLASPHNQIATIPRRTSSQNKKPEPKGKTGDVPQLFTTSTPLTQFFVTAVASKTRKHSTDDEDEAPTKKKGKSE